MVEDTYTFMEINDQKFQETWSRMNSKYTSVYGSRVNSYLNKHFSRNHVFFHWWQKLKTRSWDNSNQVECNAFHINTRNTFVNVGELYRIFTFRFSFWILFNAQLMNFILRVMFFFWLFKIGALSLPHRGWLKYCFYFENSRLFNWVKLQTPIAQLDWWD